MSEGPEGRDLPAFVKERNARLDAFRDGMNERAARLGVLLPMLAERLEAIRGVLSDAYVLTRPDARTLRSVTLKFGALPVRTPDPERHEAVMGAALHFGESTGADLVCVVHPFHFEGSEEEPEFRTILDPLKWDIDAELPALLERFLDVAERSHPYRGVEGDAVTEEAVPGAFPGLPPEEGHAGAATSFHVERSSTESPFSFDEGSGS